MHMYGRRLSIAVGMTSQLLQVRWLFEVLSNLRYNCKIYYECKHVLCKCLSELEIIRSFMKTQRKQQNPLRSAALFIIACEFVRNLSAF